MSNVSTLNSSANSTRSLAQNSELFTTKQIAEQLNTSPKVVIANAKKCLKTKAFENGRVTLFTKEEATLIIEQMKKSRPNQNTFTAAVQVVSTELTPALKIKQAMEMMQEAYEEELQNLRAKNISLTNEVTSLTPDAESWRAFAEKSGNYCVTNVARCLNVSPKIIFNFLKLKNYITRDPRTSKWIGTMYGINTGIVVNEIWENHCGSGIQMRLTPKGMQKIQQTFDVNLAAEDFIEKGEAEYQKIMNKTAEKLIAHKPDCIFKAE